ncbi:DUF1707 domain-containing protein [Kribbella speibonae]|uniref:DUF1707 domain-containing protein n=1 Tax=Kribbella speibonae TaxID=1572660 RepID=A0A4R0J5U5_9ACTN|nr:DUF1707 domain-containing protein [Kribbella speibonae]TCC40940.1 DUF1707 domain-containing protein [Kribbella speibonae]
MAIDAILEHVLLRHLEHAPLTRAELVRRTGVGDDTLQTALNELVGGTYVVRRSQQGLPTEYELTANGAIRLKVVTELVQSPGAAIGKAITRMVAAAIVEGTDGPPVTAQPPVKAQRPAGVRWPAGVRRPRPPADAGELVLTDADRSFCSAALAQQVATGRILEAEAQRRSHLLYAARTRADLAAVFANLEPPDLDAPRPEPEPVEWRPDWPRYRQFVPSLVLMLVFAGVLAYSRSGLLLWAVYFVVVIGNLGSMYRAWRKGDSKP